MALTKKLRLTSAKEISSVFTKSRPLHEGGISVRVTEGTPSAHGVAVLIPTGTTPRATQRNALRRQVSEALRHILHNNPNVVHKKIIFTVRSVPSTTKALQEVLVLLLKKSDILQK